MRCFSFINEGELNNGFADDSNDANDTNYSLINLLELGENSILVMINYYY